MYPGEHGWRRNKRKKGKISNKITISVDFNPHKAQQELITCPARFQVVCCGRRWGKTLYALNKLFKAGMEKPGQYWFTAPTYKIGIKPKWDAFTHVFRDFIEYKNESDLRCRLVSGARIDWLSLEQYDNIRGEGLMGLIMDEAAQVHPEAWSSVLRPSLMDRRGWALFISTPKARNWFWKLFRRGVSDKKKDVNYKAFRFPSWSNPYLYQSEIDDIAEDLTETLYRQEIGAEFLEDELAAIKNVDALSIAPQEELPHINKMYIAGVDLARKKDWTVISVFDVSGVFPVEVALWRANKVSWDEILNMVARVCKQWRCKAIVDATGIGDIACSELRKKGVRLEEFMFNEQSKRNLIDNMIIRFDNKAVNILKHDIANDEMKAFEMTTSRTGKVSYNAPHGDHDDCVIARALALWESRAGRVQSTAIMPDPPQFAMEKGFWG